MDLPLKIRDQDGPPYTDILDASGRLLATIYPAGGVDPLRNILAAEKEAAGIVARVNLHDELLTAIADTVLMLEVRSHPTSSAEGLLLTRLRNLRLKVSGP